VSPIEELQRKGKEMNHNQNEDDPPFNFQAMLRKTNYVRDSLKRSGSSEYGGTSSYNDNRNNNTNTYHYNRASPAKRSSRKKGRSMDGMIETELAPGLVLVGHVSDL